jgi:hypothetical protein
MLHSSLIWRVGYLVAAILLTAYTLSVYAVQLQQYLAIRYSFFIELVMVCGQVLFQAVWLGRRAVTIKIQYTFHLLTVSLIGSGLLWLFVAVARWLTLPDYTALVYFLAVVAIMFAEHRRRVRVLDLPSYLSYTWILYRILILFFIL